MIYMRALQIVYGIRLEHFYMVGLRWSKIMFFYFISPAHIDIGFQDRKFLTLFLAKSKAYLKLMSFTKES